MRRWLLLFCFSLGIASTGFATGPWLATETDNFTFLFREHEAAAVKELLTYAEDLYAELTTFLGTTTPRVTVVVYGETDLANGLYTFYPPQRIVLYTVQPSIPWLGGDAESWLRLLFVHELTHFIQANHRPGFMHGFGQLFGTSLSAVDNAFLPA